MMDFTNKAAKALMKSEKKDWNTPPEFMEYVYRLFPSGIDLDPCSNSGSIVAASYAMDGSEGKDGLLEPWQKGIAVCPYNVFVNPPYGRQIGKWIEKIASEIATCNTIALVPSRTDTKWFNRAMHTASAVCFIRGRITFLGAPHPAPFPSAVFAWVLDPGEFFEVFSELGPVLWTTPTDVYGDIVGQVDA